MANVVEKALIAAQKAVQFDRNKEYRQALYYYEVAVKSLSGLSLGVAYDQKIADYRERISAIRKLINEEDEKQDPISQDKSELHRCEFLVSQALDADEAGHKDVAVKLYTDAADLGLRVKVTTPEIKAKLTNLIRLALDRAESLKGIKKQVDNTDDIIASLNNLQPVPENDPSDTVSPLKLPTANAKHQTRPVLHRGSSAHLKVTGGSITYTEEEKKVLLHSSHINDKEFVPFMNVDLSERFQYAIPFTDKDGLLALAPEQKAAFARWCRPEEIFSEPKMVVGRYVDYLSIKQTVISDCSFVASLAVSAQYERRFGRRLITSIIYPKHRNNEPIYNPFGKYMVKLHINGIPRKVIIDDLLPVNRHNQLLCSYSSNRGELWVSLLEKAYMKVMGGYDFPGSGSNIDLHALTGWIPDRYAIKSDDVDFNKDSLFETLRLRLHKGDILITVGTGSISDAEADRTGLVPTHAYAVLDVREINGVRLFQLKNPWSYLRWKGNYSELDTQHWTRELRELLNYDPDSASELDNGVFWIDYNSICQFFVVFFVNWNPGLFNYTYCIHQMWNAGIGPVKDVYNIGDNPQFLLEVQGNTTGAVWILLTRHITDIADFRENKEYITVLVYRNNGKRVYYPDEPYIHGIRINSPHYLCKIKLENDSDTRYTLVISQYEKTHTIYYTLRAYATCPFKLWQIPQLYKYEKEITDGQWKGITAGGCSNHATYTNNPSYQLDLESAGDNNYVLIILKGPKVYQIGFDIVTVTVNNPNAEVFKSKNSGAFRSGFVYVELERVPAGTYHIIPSTYLPGQEGPFFLTCKSSCNLQLRRIQ
ncbi:hypothetical protein KPH14_012135 [Odynerus spinipes]|uniref:Calpain catalytic domain-containing protein n=1 Tax=Odynerus spinipes TaxID=1348599 RepID=A0AAD9VL74_9HYME|nr:hypothetical protein KPH14_012135 [Odynerus spinipes]